MSSGITVDDECVKAYEEMKLRKNCGYIIYKISKDLKTIEIANIGGKDAPFDEFKSILMKAAADDKEGRYAVFDHNHSSLIFMTCISDSDLGVKQKMLYSSSKKTLREKLTGIQVDMQVNDLCDLCEAACAEKCSKKI